MKFADQSSRLTRGPSQEIFLESRLPLQVFATLTVARPSSVRRLDDYFNRWTRVIQSHNRLTVGWIRAIEAVPSRHIHAVLVAAASLDCGHATWAWQQIAAWRHSEAAVVKTYIYSIGGLDYVMKSLDRPNEDIQNSRNLNAFDPKAGVQFYGSKLRERRQIRRIRGKLLSGTLSLE